MADGYGEIEELENKQNTMLDEQSKLQEQIIDTQTKQSVTRLEKDKEEQEKEAIKEASGLYTDYKKQSQQFGVNQEQLIAQGLGNSGYSESSQVSLYNNYQKNVTNVMNTNAKLKADFDLSIEEAYQNADIQKANKAINILEQKSNNLLNIYQLRKEQEKFLYQKERDKVADDQWERSFALQQQNFALQQQQAQQSQSNWEREYALSLQNSNRRYS